MLFKDLKKLIVCFKLVLQLQNSNDLLKIKRVFLFPRTFLKFQVQYLFYQKQYWFITITIFIIERIIKIVIEVVGALRRNLRECVRSAIYSVKLRRLVRCTFSSSISRCID